VWFLFKAKVEFFASRKRQPIAGTWIISQLLNKEKPPEGGDSKGTSTADAWRLASGVWRLALRLSGLECR
jgi:hypothetical protein